MPHPDTRTPLPSKFTPLVTFLATRGEEESVTLTLAEIEAIIGRPLATSAHVSPSWWVQASERHVRDLRAIGWRTPAGEGTDGRVSTYALTRRGLIPSRVAASRREKWN
jgi:hypothetical protein